MDQSGSVKHEGIIKAVEMQSLVVELLVDGSCTSCEMAGNCEVSSSGKKIIRVKSMNNSYSIGQKVWVELSDSKGLLAAFLGYGLPFILLLTVMWLTSLYLNELKAGLLSLLAVSLYYGILFLIRKQMNASFEFSIDKTNGTTN